jgi:hypothetical protein
MNNKAMIILQADIMTNKIMQEGDEISQHSERNSYKSF